MKDCSFLETAVGKRVCLKTGDPMGGSRGLGAWHFVCLPQARLRPHVFQDILAEAKQAALAREEGMTIIYQPGGLNTPGIEGQMPPEKLLVVDSWPLARLRALFLALWEVLI